MSRREDKLKVLQALQEGTITKAESRTILQAIDKGLSFVTKAGEPKELRAEDYALMELLDRAQVFYFHVEIVEAWTGKNSSRGTA